MRDFVKSVRESVVLCTTIYGGKSRCNRFEIKGELLVNNLKGRQMKVSVVHDRYDGNFKLADMCKTYNVVEELIFLYADGTRNIAFTGVVGKSIIYVDMKLGEIYSFGTA